MKSITRKTMWLLLILLSVLVACNDDSDANVIGGDSTTIPMADSTIFFLQQEPVDGERENLTAELFGKLVLVEDCIRVNHDESDVSYAIIWPPDFTLNTENGVVEVFSDASTVHVGDEVRISGGEFRYLSEQEKSKLFPNCLGPYWIVGSEVSMIELENVE